MIDDRMYCCVCDKVIPDGETYFVVSVMREHIVPGGGCSDVDGIADDVFHCHEGCMPCSVNIDLTPFGGSGPVCDSIDIPTESTAAKS